MADQKCIFCLDVKTEPIGIPCGHTFCNMCFEDYKRIGKGTTCPLCRTPFVSNIDQDLGIDPLSNLANFEEANRYLEEINRLIEMVPDGFQQDVSFLDGLFEARNEVGNLANSQRLSPTVSVAHSYSPFDEEEEPENDNQIEFDVIDEQDD